MLNKKHSFNQCCKIIQDKDPLMIFKSKYVAILITFKKCYMIFNNSNQLKQQLLRVDKEHK